MRLGDWSVVNANEAGLATVNARLPLRLAGNGLNDDLHMTCMVLRNRMVIRYLWEALVGCVSPSLIAIQWLVQVSCTARGALFHASYSSKP